LSPDDRHLAERDPAMPGLSTVLDDEALTASLIDRWPQDRERPERVRVTYVRYKPGTLLLATVVADFDGRSVTGLLATAAAGESIVKLDKIVQHAARRSGVLPVIPDFERQLVFAPIEADRHLRGIDRLADRIRWIDRSLKGAELSVLGYKPHRRLVVRADVDGEPRATIKVHATHLVPEVVAALTWAASKRSDRLALPQLIGMDADHGVVITDWVPGAALDDVAPDRRRSTLRSVGKLLGRLHLSPPTGLSPRPANRPGLPSLVTAIGRLRPDLVERAGMTLSRPRGGSGSWTPVHGDLSADQVVHGREGVGLIDLDRAGLGVPGADIASWVAAQHATAESPAHACELPAALLEGYRSVGGPATDADIAEQLPVELLRRATDPFRQRLPDWSERMTSLVDAAERSHRLRTAS
jgi:hypothetical protein